jgi:hypothetical protein
MVLAIGLDCRLLGLDEGQVEKAAQIESEKCENREHDHKQQ